jgi:formylglycine-generating enzyme
MAKMTKKVFILVILALLIPLLGIGFTEGTLKAGENDGMILVPAGDFMMGMGENQRYESVAAFYIDKFEVSNADYKKFLAWIKKNSDKSVRHPDQPADKDHTPRHWKKFRPALLKETGIAKLQEFDDDTFTKDNHPVVGIDWYDAYAYAKWVKKRLPTEAEWEKAAKGTEDNIWPWGKEWKFALCNSGGYEWKGERDGYIYSAPVDAYPEGQSPYGVYNMAGNVWEWTADDFDSDKKVIKGGGSDSYPSTVMPAVRKGYEVEYRYFTLGFRCAKSRD